MFLEGFGRRLSETLNEEGNKNNNNKEAGFVYTVTLLLWACFCTGTVDESSLGQFHSIHSSEGFRVFYDAPRGGQLVVPPDQKDSLEPFLQSDRDQKTPAHSQASR